MSELTLKRYAELYSGLPSVQAVTPNTRASAFLLSGEDEDGLATLARIVAARILGIDESRAFDDFADIVTYPQPPEVKKAKGKKADDAPKSKKYAISVEDIREIIDNLYLTPFELNKRVYIIENAESMSEICQNKLLKSLEEPPSRVCFILCACGRLLPTVASRCNKIELAPFSIEKVAEALSPYHKDKLAVSLAARASRGNLGLAESILADKTFAETYKTAKQLLIFSSGSRNFAHAAATYEKYTRDRLDKLLGIIEYLLCDIARLLSGCDTVFDRQDIEDVKAGFTPYSAAKCAEHVRAARKANAQNGMPSAVMDIMILKIMEEKALCQRS
ncbi:MAG: hypothetical protein HDT28_09700 [Clostridiales bacterium]|nr:hypothetical protein [Clostridiales bacterium]